MAKIVYGLQQSLDGYVDHQRLGPPDPSGFAHFFEHVRDAAGLVYGRQTYEIMQYWDEDQPGWDAQDRAFAQAWRATPKWVASRSLKAVGPNATLIQGDVEAALRALKARLEGELDVAGPQLARSVGEMGLIDEYRLYFRPVTLGSGVPFFAAERPPLRLTGAERIGEEMVRLTYVPAG